MILTPPSRPVGAAAFDGQALLVAPACCPRHVRRGEPRTGWGVPATVTGLAACGGRGVNAVGDPVAVCCSSGSPNGLAASGAPGAGGKPPRPPAMNELVGRPPRAAQVSRNWLLASRKVPGNATKLSFSLAMTTLPAKAPEAWLRLSGVRMSWP